MRIFKTKHFSKWSDKHQVNDNDLRDTANHIEDGLFEANLGGGVLKIRVGTRGRGKRGSVRVIVAFKKGDHCFFVYGFEKNEKSNISSNEEKALKIVAKELFQFSDLDLSKRLKTGALVEVNYE